MRCGLITRKANPKDRRGVDAQLTGKALRLIDDAVGRHVENEQRMLEPRSRTEREQLDRATRKLLAHLAGPTAGRRVLGRPLRTGAGG